MNFSELKTFLEKAGEAFAAQKSEMDKLQEKFSQLESKHADLEKKHSKLQKEIAQRAVSFRYGYVGLSCLFHYRTNFYILEIYAYCNGTHL